LTDFFHYIFPWNSMEFHGIPLNFMKVRLMEFHGIPWNFVNWRTLMEFGFDRVDFCRSGVAVRGWLFLFFLVPVWAKALRSRLSGMFWVYVRLTMYHAPAGSQNLTTMD
jgi:hypothetical protein